MNFKLVHISWDLGLATNSCMIFLLLFFGVRANNFAQKPFQDNLSIIRPRYQYQKPHFLPTIVLENKNLSFAKSRDITAALHKMIDNIADPKFSQVQGYRLMVFSDRDREKAENAKRKALKVFGEEKVVIVFERPNYRIKVGEYLSKADADEAKKQALRHFSEVVVVPDWIKIVKLSQSKPD